MQFVIKVVSIGPTETKKTAKGSYSVFELTYKEADGKTKTKKIFSFNKEVHPVLSNAQPGQHYQITAEKPGEYWEWVSVATVDAPSGEPQAAASGKASAGTAQKGWQADPEKDAKIARAVALKGAIDYLAGVASAKAEKGVEAVLKVSKEFEDYLLNGYIPGDMKKAIGEDTFEDDIPFRDE